jgi:CheY-like chemotaxis protein
MALRIFVVEDNPDFRMLLCELLKALGHIVTAAATINGALRKIPSSNIDVLICDIKLPDGTGWDLLRLAPLPTRVCAIAFSGDGAPDNIARSTAAGFHHHLMKHRGLERLEQVLASVERDRDAMSPQTRAVSSR